uniref:Putative secreted protein n=1 Tax=Anopheles darlingi TaxID=43151 RepID=A0A2M4D5B6_ANODA
MCHLTSALYSLVLSSCWPLRACCVNDGELCTLGVLSSARGVRRCITFNLLQLRHYYYLYFYILTQPYGT